MTWFLDLFDSFSLIYFFAAIGAICTPIVILAVIMILYHPDYIQEMEE